MDIALTQNPLFFISMTSIEGSQYLKNIQNAKSNEEKNCYWKMFLYENQIYNSQNPREREREIQCTQAAFLLAISEGHTTVVEFLLSNNASSSIHTASNKHYFLSTALFWASYFRRTDMIQLILGIPDINISDIVSEIGDNSYNILLDNPELDLNEIYLGIQNSDSRSQFLELCYARGTPLNRDSIMLAELIHAARNNNTNLITAYIESRNYKDHHPEIVKSFIENQTQDFDRYYAITKDPDIRAELVLIYLTHAVQFERHETILPALLHAARTGKTDMVHDFLSNPNLDVVQLYNNIEHKALRDEFDTLVGQPCCYNKPFLSYQQQLLQNPPGTGRFL